jgi:NADH:ubiquinone oxidoreductase subunit K
VTLLGTVQLQFPTVVKVRIVSPLDAVVEVGTQLFALAGIGIETNNPEIRVVITIETIFDRAALTFMLTKSRIIFTSLLE